MKSFNFKALLIASIVAIVTFLIVEFVVENLLARPYGINDSSFMESMDSPPSGITFQSLNLLIFIFIMTLIMGLHITIRPRFSTAIKAALITSSFFLALLFLFLANFANLGIFSWQYGLTSFLFNLIELPIAIIAGALSYSARTEGREQT